MSFGNSTLAPAFESRKSILASGRSDNLDCFLRCSLKWIPKSLAQMNRGEPSSRLR